MLKMIEFYDNIRENIPELVLKKGEPLSKYTSFRIGGKAELVAFPKNEKQLTDLLKLCHKSDINPAILGAGTNVLAPDEGVLNLVICLKDALDGMEMLDSNRIRVMAGVSMSRAAVFAGKQGLSGLEFAHGIPGSVGGGVFMNAGAYGGEIKDVCIRAQIADHCGNMRWLEGEELGFSYRFSSIQDKGWIVIAAEFQLTPKPQEQIREKMKELAARRKASQPLDLPSAGSAFKRPETGYAAALIDEAGLKGYRIGNAAVSEKHAGFVVNLGGATAEDVKKLLSYVSDKVYDHSGVRLTPEIRIW